MNGRIRIIFDILFRIYVMKIWMRMFNLINSYARDFA